MATATKRIDDDVRTQLKLGSWNDLNFTMPQMDPKLYQKVKKVMESLGGKWNRKAQAIVFEDEDARDSLMEAAETGEYVDLKKAYQQFFTPESLADRMAAELMAKDGDTVLEPSAGTGRLVQAMDRYANKYGWGISLIVVELDKSLIPHLVAQANVTIAHQGDFLAPDLADPDDQQTFGKIDGVIMNPPFTRGQDIDHVCQAFAWLKPGGRLVALTSPSWTFHTSAKAVSFRNFVEEHGWWEEVPESTFKESGTNIRTILIVLEKPKSENHEDNQSA